MLNVTKMFGIESGITDVMKEWYESRKTPTRTPM